MEFINKTNTVEAAVLMILFISISNLTEALSIIFSFLNKRQTVHMRP